MIEYTNAELVLKENYIIPHGLINVLINVLLTMYKLMNKSVVALKKTVPIVTLKDVLSATQVNYFYLMENVVVIQIARPVLDSIQINA